VQTKRIGAVAVHLAFRPATKMKVKIRQLLRRFHKTVRFAPPPRLEGRSHDLRAFCESAMIGQPREAKLGLLILASF
jgi:hypothetical protein